MTCDQFLPEPGLIILFGSGETSPTGRKIFEFVFKSLPPSPRLALLETPAGFELNSHQVISRVEDFFIQRLQNYSPQVDIIPARKRGTKYSPDDAETVSPILTSDLIFMGPGSPTYAIHQLRESLAWYYLVARHRLGAVLALASAASIAFSTYALPVYEIYKVGEDLHWVDGLDFFRLYGLRLVIIPHWNNHEGGTELDTSRCFMGRERFAHLMEMLPDKVTIVGLDEKTALMMDPAKSECHVKGLGAVTLLHTGHKHLLSSSPVMDHMVGTDQDLVKIAEQRNGHVHQEGSVFPMSELGPFHAYYPEGYLPASIWQKAIQARFRKESGTIDLPSKDVLLLIQARQNARQMRNWAVADELRLQIAKLGWEIMDTDEGPVSKKLPFQNN
jgi:hypothetical protein